MTMHKIYLVSHDTARSTYNPDIATRLKDAGYKEITSSQYRLALKVCRVMKQLKRMKG